MKTNENISLWLVDTCSEAYSYNEKQLRRVGMVTLPAEQIRDVERSTYPHPYLRIGTKGCGSFYVEEAPGERARLLRIIADCEIAEAEAAANNDNDKESEE